MTKEEMIKCVEDSDRWLTETKKLIEAHEGEKANDKCLNELMDLVVHVMRNQTSIRYEILRKYGIFVMTEN